MLTCNCLRIGDSDLVKKTMALYIDCNSKKTFVTELRKLNKLISDVEVKRELQLELDIDNVEALFENDVFENKLNAK